MAILAESSLSRLETLMDEEFSKCRSKIETKQAALAIMCFVLAKETTRSNRHGC